MCGVVVIVNRDGRPVEAAQLDVMGERLAARGPDGVGCFIDGAVGLYHRRLAIFDPGAGPQPMSHPAGVHLVFNGAVYNHVELRAALEADGARFRTHTDTEVVLEMLVRDGLDCLPAFNGAFGLVAYDARGRRLLVARDRFGVRPLYVYEGSRHLLIASEIKALLAHPAVRAEVDPESLNDYLTFQHVIGAGTLFAGIRKVQPGECFTFDLDHGTLVSRRWWAPRYGTLGNGSGAHQAEALEAIVHDAVRLRTRADVPMGVELSGGLDSSVLAVLAARHVDLVAFHGRVAGGPSYDESSYARAVAKHAGVELVEVPIDGQDLADRLPGLIWTMDEPAAGPGLIGQSKVAEVASGRVKVLLGGHGADEVFGGYARYLAAYLEQALKGAIQGTNDEGEHIVSWQTILPNLPVLQGYEPMLRALWSGGLFEPMDRRYFKLLDRAGAELSLYAEPLRAAHDPEVQFARFAALFHNPDTPSYINKMRAFDRAGSLPALLHVADRVDMGVGVEGRAPFLDHRIVEHVDNSPPRLVFGGGNLKHLLRQVARPLLPPGVAERTDKMGFPVPLADWFKGPARGLLGDVLFSPASRQRGVIDAPAVERSLQEDVGYNRRLWGALCLELWFQTFIDE